MDITSMVIGTGLLFCLISYVRIIYNYRQEELWLDGKRDKPKWLIKEHESNNRKNFK